MSLKKIAVAGTRTIATLDSSYTIMAVCTCGRTRELHTLSLRRRLGAGVTINGCGQSCGATNARRSSPKSKSTDR
jgi:hypothetical protein